ncbi:MULTISPECIES: hypothetical protein [unclassified Enterococcus]|uniref:hypothetical protein n=1 Tax=unclassified Enterococcus TaxID=2608891 RepID=UPI003F24E7FB
MIKILATDYIDSHKDKKESTLERLQKDIKRIECQREEWGTNEYPFMYQIMTYIRE